MDSKEKKENSVHFDEQAMIPLAYHEMCITRHYRTVRNFIIAIVAIVAAFVFLWLQYDYVSSTEVTGVYALVDSEGNVIASDLAPDDVIRIMAELNSGESAENQNS